jgi:hypothetical protein
MEQGIALDQGRPLKRSISTESTADSTDGCNTLDST